MRSWMERRGYTQGGLVLAGCPAHTCLLVTLAALVPGAARAGAAGARPPGARAAAAGARGRGGEATRRAPAARAAGAGAKGAGEERGRSSQAAAAGADAAAGGQGHLGRPARQHPCLLGHQWQGRPRPAARTVRALGRLQQLAKVGAAAAPHRSKRSSDLTEHTPTVGPRAAASAASSRAPRRRRPRRSSTPPIPRPRRPQGHQRPRLPAGRTGAAAACLCRGACGGA